MYVQGYWYECGSQQRHGRRGLAGVGARGAIRKDEGRSWRGVRSARTQQQGSAWALVVDGLVPLAVFYWSVREPLLSRRYPHRDEAVLLLRQKQQSSP